MVNFRFNLFTTIFIFLVVVFMGLVWADTNGVWHRAEDIRGGVIAQDEQDVTTNFTFIHPVYFMEKIGADKICDKIHENFRLWITSWRCRGLKSFT